ncbi:MAG: hypothetical protein RMI30_02370 [Thermodesulfovibrio sp.]|nr:hypothetical protein [Thermodesulfovibrio sp.]MDW7998281.1 hypothetical protein [Thermodesulfovibrio sp.]
MNPKEPLQEQSKIRTLLIRAELALKEDRFDEALAVLSGINIEEMATLQFDELQAIGALLNYLRDLAEEKKNSIVEKLQIVQISKNYLG